jgi:hypothetical protein
MKLVCRNLFLRGHQQNSRWVAERSPAATAFTGNLAAGPSWLRNAVFIWPMVS